MPGVQSLDRAFNLLCLLAEHHETGLTLPQLVAQTGIDRTTAHRMLRYLTHAGFAGQDEQGKRYRLGMAAMAMGLRTMNRSPLANACATRMKALARKTGARGLRSILELALIDTMFELPHTANVEKVVVDENTIEENQPPLLVYRESAKKA